MEMGLADLYARWVLGGSARRDVYTYGEFDREVVWVDSDRWGFAGQNLFGTIFLNEQVLQKGSNDLADYVFLHEVGHGQFHFIPRTILLLLRFVFTGIALLGVPTLLVQSLVFLSISPSIATAGIMLLGTILTLLLVLIPLVIVSWVDEGWAEVFAVSQIGVSQYRDCIEEMRELSDKGRFKRVLRRLIYPPPSLVIWSVNRS